MEGELDGELCTETTAGLGVLERQDLAIRISGALPSAAHVRTPFSLSHPTLGELKYQHSTFWSACRPKHGGYQDDLGRSLGMG